MADSPRSGDSDSDDNATGSETEEAYTLETADGRDITYSLETTVAAITSYYEFLTKMYVEPEVVIKPPPGGWPEITVEFMRELGKTDEVAELLRRIPYIRPRTRNPRDEVHGAGHCIFANWVDIIRNGSHYPRPFSSGSIDAILAETEGSGIWESIPSHVVGLSSWSDYQIFLDTQLGAVYFSGLQFAPGPVGWALYHRSDIPLILQPVNDRPDDYAPEEEEDWRGAHDDCCWGIEDFFEMLKFHFRQLNYVPSDRRKVFAGWSGDEHPEHENYSRIRAVFREHGWPDLTRYQKDRCIGAVEELTNELDLL